VAVVALLIGTPGERAAASASVSPVPGAVEPGHGRWSRLPLAPLQARACAAATAWTGRELLVWGGISDRPYYPVDKVYGDGAAYDPARHRWRSLPPAPISPRAGGASAWTGRQLIVWGGLDEPPTDRIHAAADGAAYDPATDTWSVLPPAPLSARAAPVTAWTGTRMIVLGGWSTAANGLSGEVLGQYTDGAAYDPAARTWTPIPPLIDPAGRQLTLQRAVATDHGLLAWAQWQVGSGKAASTGSELFSYDPRTNLWTYVLPTTGALDDVTGAVWTGREVFATGTCFGGCGEQAVVARIYHPDSNTWAVIPQYPRNSLDGPMRLVGHHVLTFAVNDSGPGSLRYTAAAAAYDLATDTWQPVPDPPPFHCQDNAPGPALVGRTVLYYCPHPVDGRGARHDGVALTLP
jgi:hypothetical protein